MPKNPKNISASARARLLRVSKQTGVIFDFVLNRYAVERFLYRVSLSRYSEQFVLKGATLLLSRFDAPFRMTRDLDLLSLDDTTSEKFEAAFKEILEIDVQDGIEFDPDNLNVRRMDINDPYGGVRMQISAELDRARIKFGIDIINGDATEPGLEKVEYPVLIEMPAPYLRGYALETVIAEKFHAMVEHGVSNSRIKDYVDLYHMSQSFEFERLRIAEAILATFKNRQTEIPTDTPPALSAAFVQDPMRIKQWEYFKQKMVFVDSDTFTTMVTTVEEFVMPAARDAIMLAKKRGNKPVAFERAVPYLRLSK